MHMTGLFLTSKNDKHEFRTLVTSRAEEENRFSHFQNVPVLKMGVRLFGIYFVTYFVI